MIRFRLDQIPPGVWVFLQIRSIPYTQCNMRFVCGLFLNKTGSPAAYRGCAPHKTTVGTLTSPKLRGMWLLRLFENMFVRRLHPSQVPFGSDFGPDNGNKLAIYFYFFVFQQPLAWLRSCCLYVE